MVKYVTNNFLTVKVAFANEIAQICEALDKSGNDVDYDKVIEYAKYDPRLGNSHWSVPGPDGHKGFGGHCFPKDINAMICVASNLGVDAKVLKSAWEKNKEVRQDRDWERRCELKRLQNLVLFCNARKQEFFRGIANWKTSYFFF